MDGGMADSVEVTIDVAGIANRVTGNSHIEN
jgi:hypothetical protein